MARPSKLTPELQKKIVTAISSGNYYEAACAYGGVSYKVFREWMIKGEEAKSGRYREFFQSVKHAIELKENVSFEKYQEKQREKDSSRGCVYFIKDMSLGKVKIGYAKNYEKRLRDHQISCPQELILIALISHEHALKLEKELHKKFKSKHFRGEWYSLSDDDIYTVVKYHDGVYL